MAVPYGNRAISCAHSSLQVTVPITSGWLRLFCQITQANISTGSIRPRDDSVIGQIDL